jgi:WD40 repeat protein
LIAGIPVLSLTGHSKSVEQVMWDTTGRYLVTGAEDTFIMLWDVGSTLKKGTATLQTLATPLRKWKLPKAVEANCLCWSADGRTIAAVALDQNIYLINAGSSAPATTLQDASQQNNFTTPFYTNIAWSPTSAYFVTNDLNIFKTQVGLWQYGHSTSPQILSFHDANSSQTGASMDFVSWSSDGKLLAGHTNFGEVAIWDMTTKQVSQVIKMADRPQFKNLFINNECLAWSPTEQVLAASDFDYTYVWDVKNNKQLLTLQVNEPLLQHDIHPPYVWNMTWSPNGRYLALCYPRSPRIYVWDIQALRASTSPTKPVSQTLLFPQKSISNGSALDIAWSPDGRYIAAGYGDSTVIIWKVDGA